jgi:PAT family beta-lactamase induction signal transducer AmpG
LTSPSATEPPAPAPGSLRAGLQALSVYRDPRQLAIFGMGFSSGLPLPLTTTTLAYWLARDGLDKTSIGLFALVGLPYSFKFLWAPLLDLGAPPGLASLGRRRGWIVVLQAALVASIAALGFVDPGTTPLATAAVVLAIAFFSATQDIAIDAYRIEILGDREQGAGAAVTQAGYRAGLLASGAGALALSDYASWPETFAVLALLLGLSTFGVLASREPVRETAHALAPPAARDDGRAGGSMRIADALRRAFLDPIADLATRPRWPLILGFAVLYKLGESIGQAMSNPFFVELGFSGVEIATLTKVVGLAASVVGILVGGALVARTSIRPALILGGCLQAVTNLLYVWLSAAGHDLNALAVVVVADQFTGGVASAAFVAYLSSLSRGAFSGTQFALLTSLMALGRTLFGGASGWLATSAGWPLFWVCTALLALPGLLLLAVLQEPGRTARDPA